MLGAGLIYFSEAESSAPLQTQSPGGSNCRPSLTPVSLFHPLSKKDTISPFIPGYIYICVCVYIYIYIYNYTHFCMYQSVTSVAQSCLTLYNPMDCSTADLPVHHQLLEFTQTHVHWVGDASQPSHPLSSPSPPALNFSHHQDLFKWVSPLYQVAKVLEFRL